MNKSKVHKLMIGSVITITIIAFLAINMGGSSPEVSEDELEEYVSDAEVIHTFDGEIDNIDGLEEGEMIGIGVYDRNCNPVDPENPHGEVTCDAGVQTEEKGLVNFHYQHVMSENPCIGPNEIVKVEVVGENGEAKIHRLNI